MAKKTDNENCVREREWLVARKELLMKEKEFTKLRDQLSAERRALPWVKVEKSYVFDAPEGKATLAQLFDGRSQLFIKHFMMGPGQNWQCVGCSFEVDHVEGILVHLENHDVTYVAVARAPIEEIEVIRKRMGWRFRWVSSYNTDFNYDFNVSFRPEEVAAHRAYYNYAYTDPGVEDLPGYSVFFKNDSGQIFHTYSTYGRGVEEFMGAYRFLDATPNDRNENGPNRDLTGYGSGTCTVRASRLRWLFSRSVLSFQWCRKVGIGKGLGQILNYECADMNRLDLKAEA